MLSPCKNCEKREVGCHGTCKDYQMFNEQQISVRKKRYLETGVRSYEIESKRRTIKRRRCK